MKFSLSIKDRFASISVEVEAIPQHNPRLHKFTLRGLPTLWSTDHAEALITKALKRKGFNAISLAMTSSTLHRWNAVVRFWVPETSKETTKETTKETPSESS